MASLNDKQEEDYVKQIMKSMRHKIFHIGLAATEYPGFFEWLDGSKFTYKNWADGHPVDFTGKSLFVSVEPKGWVSSVGDNKVGFMCEYRLGESSQLSRV